LIERFTNPSLKHQTWQIAMDGSQKIPQRMGGSLRHHLAQGTEFKWLAMGIAGWMRYVSAQDERGEEIDVRDPMVEQFKAIYAEHGLNVSAVKALLSIEAIFGTDLIRNEVFVEAVTNAYQLLLTEGARGAVASL